VCAVNETRNRGTAARVIFYKYVPNLRSGHWGSSFIYVCFCLPVPQGACFPLCLQGLLPAQGGGARMLFDARGHCPCPGRWLGAGQRTGPLGRCCLFLAILNSILSLNLPHLRNGDNATSYDLVFDRIIRNAP
jgi:hypothetical protein